MKGLSIVLAWGLMCAWAPVGSLPSTLAQSRQKAARKDLRYSCPMHPDVISSKRGKCPRCGMTLRTVSRAPISGPTPIPAIRDTEDSLSFSSSQIPDSKVLDQNGKSLNFYSDLIKGKTVAINFIFTTCTTICPPLTATFRRVQQELGRTGQNVQLISVSVDSSVDTPERLRDFAAKFNAGPGWTFVTGEKAEIDRLLRALGVAVANKNDHTPMILIGNDVSGFWTRSYGLSSPATLIKTMTDVASHK
ncbi:MAG TPA: SCO family protein [Pyrinomonadaceae bacterium]